MDDKSESTEVETEETAEESTEETQEETKESESTEAKEDTKVEKPKETLEQKEARLARELERTRKKLGKDEPKAPSKTNTDELDETQLDFLDLKGITDEEDIEIIQSVMKKTGMTVRQALKDDYVVSKLEATKKERQVKAAIPTSKRSGQAQNNDVEMWLEKNARTGELPKDFDLRAKVVEAKIRREGDNAPAWKR